MAFAISSHTLPNIASFEACVQHVGKWRSKITKRSNAVWGEHCVPLRSFKDTSKRLEWREGSQAWACVYHHSDVVTYYRDGRIKLDASFGSMSTNIFHDNLTPFGIYTVNMGKGKGRAYRLTDGQYHEVNRRILDRDMGQALMLAPRPSGAWEVLNPQPWVVSKRVSDREKRREIMPKFKPFLNWFDAMTKVTGSIKAVVVGAEAFDDYGNPNCTRFAVEYFIKDTLEGKEVTEEQWRKACWAAMFETMGRARYQWRHIHADAQYALHHAKTMRSYILNQVWKIADAFSNITVTKPAGERP